MYFRRWFVPMVLVSGCIFILSLRQLSDPDLGFHLKYGQWITTNHAIPTTDISTYTVAGNSYIDLHWLFQVILYTVYQYAGYPGISMLVCILSLAISILILLRNKANDSPLPLTVMALLITFLIIEPRITPRPEMFTYLFLAALLLILDLYVKHRKNYLGLLPMIMLIWCNMHSLFIIGLIVIALCCTGLFIHERKADRKLVLILAISVAVCFINPYGINGFLFPFELLSRFQSENIFNRHIQEIMPFFSQGRLVLRDYLFLFVMGMTIICTLLTWRQRKIHEIALAAFFAILAFTAIRNIPFFIITVIPLLSGELQEIITRSGNFRKGLLTGLLILATITPVLIIPRLLTNDYYRSNNSFNRTGLGLDRHHQPVAASDFIAKNYPGYRILNSLGFGGWLSWVLPQPVYIDGRLEVMREGLYYEITESWKGGLSKLAEKHGAGLIVYNYRKYYSWTDQLREMKDWRLAYADGNAAVFVHDTCTNCLPAVSLSGLPVVKTATPVPERDTWLAGFYQPFDCDKDETSHLVLFANQYWHSSLEEAAAQRSVNFYNLANRRYAVGDSTGALSAYDSAVLLNPWYAKAFNNRGILRAAVFKDPIGSLHDFNRAISADPGYGDAYVDRGISYQVMGRKDEACRDWERALSLGKTQAARLIRIHCNGK